LLKEAICSASMCAIISIASLL